MLYAWHRSARALLWGQQAALPHPAPQLQTLCPAHQPGRRPTPPSPHAFDDEARRTRPLQALYQPDGGYLIPEQGIRAHVAVAQQHGARVACGTRVVSWEPAPAPASAPASAAAAHSGSGGASGDAGAAAEGVAVHTEAPGGERGSVWARRVVMAPGPWLSKLVPELGVSHLLQQLLPS